MEISIEERLTKALGTDYECLKAPTTPVNGRKVVGVLSNETAQRIWHMIDDIRETLVPQLERTLKMVKSENEGNCTLSPEQKRTQGRRNQQLGFHRHILEAILQEMLCEEFPQGRDCGTALELCEGWQVVEVLISPVWPESERDKNDWP